MEFILGYLAATLSIYLGFNIFWEMRYTKLLELLTVIRGILYLLITVIIYVVFAFLIKNLFKNILSVESSLFLVIIIQFLIILFIFQIKTELREEKKKNNSNDDNNPFNIDI